MTLRRSAAVLLLLSLPAQVQAQDVLTLCRQEAERGQTAACKTAIAINPQNAEAYALLGQAHFAGGFYNEGLEALRKAVQVSHGNAGYRYRFAGFAALVNEYPQAAAELELAALSTPDDVRLWTLLADCYRYMRNAPQALKASRRAAELGDPAEAYALALRYGSGDGVPADPQEERHWLERGAQGGYIPAMQELARLYKHGRPGIPPDPSQFRRWKDAATKASN